MRSFVITVIILLALFSCVMNYSQDTVSPSNLNGSVRTYIATHRQEIMHEFQEFLAIPNLASDAPNIQKNADALTAMLQKRGLQVQVLRVENAPPVILGALPPGSSKHTVTFYAHYDGQPLNKADWKFDLWNPTLISKSGSTSVASIDDP